MGSIHVYLGVDVPGEYGIICWQQKQGGGPAAMDWSMASSVLIGALCAFLIISEPDFWTALKRQRWQLLRFAIYFLLAALPFIGGAQTWRVGFLMGLVSEVIVSMRLNRVMHLFKAMQVSKPTEEGGSS